MKKLKNRTKRRIILCIFAVVVLILIILIVRGVMGLFGREADVTAGVEYIKQEEAGDVAEIEEKINLLEKQDSNGEDTRSLKEKFTGAVVLGDSIAAGFLEYDVLNASSVVSQIGVHLNELDDLITQVQGLSPGIIFLSVGMNDVAQDTASFTEQYRTVLEKIMEDVPDAHIFVNSIFPVQDNALEEDASLENIAACNEALKELCDSLQIGFIDNTELVQDQYYEEDGIHFKADFYPVWGERMAEVASL